MYKHVDGVSGDDSRPSFLSCFEQLADIVHLRPPIRFEHSSFLRSLLAVVFIMQVKYFVTLIKQICLSLFIFSWRGRRSSY